MQAPDPTRPPYHEPDGHLSIVPGLNITYMDEQITQNAADLTLTNEDSAAVSSAATA